MIEPWLRELVTQRQQERLAAGDEARRARTSGRETRRRQRFAPVDAPARLAAAGYSTRTDAGASS